MKTDEQEVINFLLTTEIIPLCLRIMESGSELSKTVPTLFLLIKASCCLDLTNQPVTCRAGLYPVTSAVATLGGVFTSKKPQTNQS